MQTEPTNEEITQLLYTLLEEVRSLREEIERLKEHFLTYGGDVQSMNQSVDEMLNLIKNYPGISHLVFSNIKSNWSQN